MTEPKRFVVIDADPDSPRYGSRTQPLTQDEIDALPLQHRPLDGMEVFAPAKHRAKESP